MNEKHWSQLVMIGVVLPVLTFSGPNSAVGSETAKLRPSIPAISAAPGSLAIPGATVTKGASRESVMRQLSDLYELQRLRSSQGEEDTWLISEKQDPDNYVGAVSFVAGKVHRIARFRKWTQDDDSVDLARRFCDLLAKLTSERGNKSTIEAVTADTGNVSIRGVEFVFGDERVSMHVVSRGDPASKQTEVHLDEVVQ